MKRKLFFTVVFSILLGLVFVSCPLEDESIAEFVPIENLELDTANADLFLNTPTYGLDRITLIATVSPENTNDVTSWASSNLSVATVDQNGVVTAVSEGTAIIAKIAQKSGISAICTVTVKDMNGVNP